MKYYYAQYDNGDGIDLWRFSSKLERDQWVAKRPSTASAITSKIARAHHREQFKYWSASA
jgi:hypothetical protein